MALALILASCAPKPVAALPPEKPNAAGLVRLPCGNGPVSAANAAAYCALGRNYVTPAARAAIEKAATALGARILYMDASWASGKRPMPPHFSHGDGREIDLALFYETPAGRPLAHPPLAVELPGYGPFEPPRKESERACRHGARGASERPDPLPLRNWRLDEKRTAALIRLLIADPHVRRVFIEPHLKARLGFSGAAKVRFAGCKAARHDDHLHVDFY